MINCNSLYTSKPEKWCFSHHMLEKVPLNQLQGTSSHISHKENKKRLLQTDHHICCYPKYYSQFIVCQRGWNKDRPKRIKIFLKRLDSYQQSKNTTTITRLYHCENTSKVVTKHTCSLKLIGYCDGSFLQAWNALGKLC